MFSVIKFLCCLVIFSLPGIGMEKDVPIVAKMPHRKSNRPKDRIKIKNKGSLENLSIPNLDNWIKSITDKNHDDPSAMNNSESLLQRQKSIPGRKSISTTTGKGSILKEWSNLPPLLHKKSRSNEPRRQNINAAVGHKSNFPAAKPSVTEPSIRRVSFTTADSSVTKSEDSSNSYRSSTSSFGSVSDVSSSRESQSSVSSKGDNSSLSSTGDFTRSSDTHRERKKPRKENYASILNASRQLSDMKFNHFFTWNKFRHLIRSNEIHKAKGTVLYKIYTDLLEVNEQIEVYTDDEKWRGRQLDRHVWRILDKKLLFEPEEILMENADDQSDMDAIQHKKERTIQYRWLKLFTDEQNDIDAKIDNGHSLLDLAIKYAPKPLVFALSSRINWLLIDQKLRLREIKRIFDEKRRKDLNARSSLQKIIEDSPENILKEIKNAIETGSINKPDGNGRTLAHYIGWRGLHLENGLIVQRVLLQSKLSLNVYDNNGNSPLQLMVLTAFGKYASPSDTDKSVRMFRTYLDYAFCNKYDFSWKNDDGLTLLHLLARSSERNYSPVIHFLDLIKSHPDRVDLNTLSSSGASALYYSIERGWMDDALALLKAGANPLAGEKGKDPLELVNSIINTFEFETTNFENELQAWQSFREEMIKAKDHHEQHLDR